MELGFWRGISGVSEEGGRFVLSGGVFLEFLRRGIFGVSEEGYFWSF